MKLAICGYTPLVLKMIDNIKNIGIECNYFIEDLAFAREKGKSEEFLLPDTSHLKPISFFEFRRLIDAGEIVGLIIAGLDNSMTYNVAKFCQFYDIPHIYVTTFGNPVNFLYALDNEKVIIPYLETNLIDSCNLNCKGCTHYANLFDDNDFYKLEDFKRDVKYLSNHADILKFRLLGGEPLKLKNLDKYLKIARDFLPHTNIHLVTNGLLIPSVSKKVFDSLRENSIIVDISLYPPTVKFWDKITAILKENNVRYEAATNLIENFTTFLTLHYGHNPLNSRLVCINDRCRFLRNGKIYKCPVDALSYKFVDHFGIKNFPVATGIDIFSTNFSIKMEQLEGNIELCYWCNETARQIPWRPENNPKITDWLADPTEFEKLLQEL